MKFGIVGTGAVGGYFGAKLALAGRDVVFLSRGKALRELQTNGLLFETRGEKHRITNALFTSDPAKLADCDYVLFTVKSYDTKSTAEQIKPYISQSTTIITPQNGINNDLVLAQIFGTKRIVPAFAKIGVDSPQPGYINHTAGPGELVVGEYDGTISERLETFANFAIQAGITVTISRQIQIERWKKYIWNCTFNIIAALTKLPLDQLLANDHLRELCINTIHEIILIAQREEIDFGNENVIDARIQMAQQMGAYKPSTLIDIEKGKPIELDAFTGHIITLANKHRVDVPINKTLYALLLASTVDRP